MKTFCLLTRRQFLEMFKFNKFFHGNSKQKRAFFFVFSAISLAFILISIYWFRMIFKISTTFQSYHEISNYLLKPLSVLSMVMIFLSAVKKGSGILYLDKSIDLLFSYPIKTSTLVLSKLMLVYFWGIAISFALLIIPLVRYELLLQRNGIFYIFDFLQILIIPIIPIVLGIILGYILYKLLGNIFHSGSYLKSFLYLISFTLFMAFMFFFFNRINFDNLYKHFIKKTAFSNITGTEILFAYNWRTLLFFMLVIAIGIGLTFYIIQTYKRKCMEIQMCITQKKDFKVRYKRKAKIQSLLIREILRYFSTSVYMLNTMLGIISLILFMIYSYFKKDSVSMYMELIGTTFEIENTSVLCAFVMGMLIILSNVTYASISIEGKNRELLKSFPIEIRELLLAKYLFHLSLTVTTICICAVFLGTIFEMNTLEWCLLFILPIVFSSFVGALGLFINLLFPNYEWENVTYIVKQSVSAITTILFSILIVGGALWIAIHFFNKSILLFSYILAFIFILLTILIGILLKKISKTF